MRSPFVVCGATGNIGSRIAEVLLAAGEPVRVIGRERVRLGPLAAKGAEPWPGDIGETAFLEKAFAGARGAFILIPPRYDVPDFRDYQNRLGASLVTALAKARVPRIVALSSIGAHLADGTGPILGLHDLDDPDRIEFALGALMPPEEWGSFSHRIIVHGREICHARSPECPRCPLRRWFPLEYGRRNGGMRRWQHR